MSDHTFRFDGGEFVRLRNDDANGELKAGDCGVVWGVYAFEPPLYEATFIDRNEAKIDRMFYEEEVEVLTDVQQAPFPHVLEDILARLNAFEAALRRQKSSHIH
jgi:hypothetical protein